MTMDNLRKQDAINALTHAIARALQHDARPVIEVYAELVQTERWRELWFSLSVAERNAVVNRARQEAQR